MIPTMTGLKVSIAYTLFIRAKEIRLKHSSKHLRCMLSANEIIAHIVDKRSYRLTSYENCAVFRVLQEYVSG